MIRNSFIGFPYLFSLGCFLLCSFCPGKVVAPIKKPGSLKTESHITENDSIQVKRSITGFLQWYKKNIRRSNSFAMLGTDAKGYTFVQKKACQDYLDFVKSSRFISNKFIAHWQRYFDDQAIKIKREKLTKDDVPEGFDFDFVLITQEPEIVLNKIDSLRFKIISLKKTMAIMQVTLPSDDSVQYEFEMQKTKAGWLIDYISTPNYD